MGGNNKTAVCSAACLISDIFDILCEVYTLLPVSSKRSRCPGTEHLERQRSELLNNIRINVILTL